MIRRYQVVTLGVFVGAIIGFAGFAHAGAYTARQSGNWSTPAVWDPAPGPQGPAQGDSVIIPSGIDVVYDAGASGEVATIELRPGRGSLALKRDLKVSNLLWVRGDRTLALSSQTLTGGTLRLGTIMENVGALTRQPGGRIQMDAWEHFRTPIEMDCRDSVKDLFVTNSNSANTDFTITSTTNVTRSLAVERGGTQGYTALHLKADLRLTGDFSMREGLLDDNGYHITVEGRFSNGDRRGGNWNGLSMTRKGGDLTVKDVAYGRAGSLEFRGGDRVLGSFVTHRIFNVWPDAVVIQGKHGSLTSGLSLEDAAGKLVLGRSNANDQSEITLHWDPSPLHQGCDWTLRWKGDHAAALRAYHLQGQLKIGTLPPGISFDRDAHIFYDAKGECASTSYTYVGFKNLSGVARMPMLPGGPEGPPGANDADPKGKLRLIVAFVDFSDGPGEPQASFQGLWDTLSGQGDLKAMIQRQSGGKTNVVEDVDTRWRRMPRTLAYYFPPNAGWKYSEYMNDSANLFNDKRPVDEHAIMIVVPPSTAAGFTAGSGAHSFGNPGWWGMRRIITLAPKAFTEHYTTAAHEIGHCFGPGELYPAQGTHHEVGHYDLMGDMVGATGFMGWHRHKFSWLDPQRTAYLSKPGTYRFYVNRLSAADDSIAMIGVPDFSTSPDKPQKIWVVEVNQEIVKRDSYQASKQSRCTPESWVKEGDGVLVYTAETPPAAGKREIRLRQRSPEADWRNLQVDPQAALYQPTPQKDVFSDAAAPLAVTVKERSGRGFVVEVTVKDRAATSGR